MAFNIFKWLAYLFLFTISPDVFANIFDPSPTDESMRILSIIFGPNVGTIALGSMGGTTVLPALMEKFNVIVVVVGTTVVSYTAIMSTINTAQEGSAMGKKWSAVWTPMKSVAGMVLMVPAPASGYSMIQVTVMYIVIQGIGAADQIWDIALNALSSGVSAGSSAVLPTNAPSTNSLTGNPTDPLVQLLSAQICMQTFNKMAQDPANTGQPYFGLTAKTYSDPGSVSTTTNGAQATGKVQFGVQNNSSYANICGYITLTPIIKNPSTCQSSTTYSMSNCDYPSGANVSSNQSQQDAQALYDKLVNTVQLVLNVWQPLAQAYVQNDTAGQTGSSSTPPPTSSSAQPPGYYLEAKNALVSGLSSAVVPGYASPQGGNDNSGFGGGIATNGVNNSVNMSNANSQVIQSAIAAGTEGGWIAAGSYYFIFNQTMTSRIFDYASNFITNMPNLTSGIPTCDSTCLSNVYGGNNAKCTSYDPTSSTDYAGNNSCNAFATTPSGVSSSFSSDYINLLSKYLAWGDQYSQLDFATTAPTSAFGTTGGNNSSSSANTALSGVSNAGSEIIQHLTDALNSITINGSDPLMALQIVGHDTMITCEAVWGGLLIANLALAITAGFTNMFAVYLFAFAVLAFVSGLLSTFWALGASLAIYMPLIPYMIFVTTALGWMLTVVEAIIAAPIIALGLVLPGGDELGKLEHSLMLLANVFLRPMLMIFGFLLAGRVYSAIITLISYGMSDVFKTINTFTLFSSVVVFFMYCSFILSVTNTSFSLIYALPDKVLRWIGGDHADSGAQVGQSLSETKGATSSAASQTGKDVGGGADFAGNIGAKKANAGLEAQSSARANQGGGGGGAAGGGGH